MHRNNFDFLRLFAASLVLFSHQHALTGRAEPSLLDRSLGSVGVFIFFSISGYLVALSWRRAPNLVVFARKRVARIWPGFTTVVLLAVFVLGPWVTTLSMHDYFASGVAFLPMRLLVLGDMLRQPGLFDTNPFPQAVNGSLWTIPLEVRWYVVLALAGLSGLLRRPMLLAVAVLTLLAFALQQHYTGKSGVAPPFFEYGVFFVCGVAIASVRDAFLARRRIVCVLAVLSSVVLIAADVGYVALFVLVPSMSIAFGESSTPVLSRFGRFGDFSFGVYLYAFPVQQTIVWLTDNRLPFTIGLLLSAAVALLCAIASWRWIESPVLRLEARHAKRRMQAIGA